MTEFKIVVCERKVDLVYCDPGNLVHDRPLHVKLHLLFVDVSYEHHKITACTRHSACHQLKPTTSTQQKIFLRTWREHAKHHHHHRQLHSCWNPRLQPLCRSMKNSSNSCTRKLGRRSKLWLVSWKRNSATWSGNRVGSCDLSLISFSFLLDG